MSYVDTSVTYNQIAKEFSSSRHYRWPWITQFFEDIVYSKLISVNKQNNQKLKQKPIRVLDIGCGNGRNIEAYIKDGLHIQGIDNSSEFVAICKNKNLDVSLGDMTDIRFQPNTFDFLISIASFHHLSNEDSRRLCLQEMTRVLKPNGQILLSVWSKNQPPKTKRIFENYGDVIVPWKLKNGIIIDRYYYIFKLEEIRQLFSNTGFKVLDYQWDCGNEVFILEKIDSKFM